MYKEKTLLIDYILIVSILICLSNAFFSIFSVGYELNSDYQENQLLIFTLVFLYFIAIIRLVSSNRVLTVIFDSKILILFLFVQATSFLWSENPGFTFQKSLALLLTFIAAAYSECYFQPAVIIRIIFYVLLFLMGSSLLFGLFLPDLAIHNNIPHAGNWRGVFPQKQVFGQMSVLAIVFSIGVGKYNLLHKKIVLFSIFLSFTCLILSQSRTAFLIAIALCCIIYIDDLKSKASKFFSPFISLLAFISFFSIIIFIFSDLNQFLEYFGRDTTLSGRIFLWEYAYERFLNSPLLGEGYKSFWLNNTVLLKILFEYSAVNGHNLWLDIFLELGIVGGSVLMIFLIFCFFSFWSRNFKFNYFGKVVFLFILLFGMVATIFPNPNSIYTYLIFLMYLYSSTKNLKPC